MKLHLPQYRVGKEKAEKYVLFLAKELKMPVKKKDLKGIYNYKLNDVPKIIDFPNEIINVM